MNSQAVELARRAFAAHRFIGQFRERFFWDEQEARAYIAG